MEANHKDWDGSGGEYDDESNGLRGGGTDAHHERSDELMEEFKDERMQTFIDDVKIEWDKTKFNVVKASHTGYKVKGVDKQGEFDIVRRYREFYALRTTLRKRWIGFYVPGIPEKKAIGNKDESTINERWYLLNKFLQELSLIPHLWESEEMKIFIRPKLDVEKNLNLMGIMTSDQTLERLKEYSGVDYDSAAHIGSKYKDSLRDFITSSKDILKFLESFKTFAKQIEKLRKMQIIAHGKIGGFLNKYEESTVAVYGLADLSNNRVISNTEEPHVRDTIDQLNLHALIETISHRELLENLKNKADSKKRNSQSTLDKLNAGKKTLTSIFKSSSQKANDITTLTQTIAQFWILKKYEKCLVIVDKYLGDTALPTFKKKIAKNYFIVMKDLSGSEQLNSAYLLEAWKVVHDAFSQKLQ